jgi:LPS export ABC transporter protein LptC
MNKRMKNRILILLLILLSLLFGCSKLEEDQPTNTPNKSTYPDQELWKSKISITNEGRRIANVWAGYIAVYSEKKIADLKDSIHVDFYDREGKHNSVLTADSGVVYSETNDLNAMGHVVVVSDSGIILQSDQLSWDNQRQKIVSDVPVRFTTSEDTLIGDSFVSDPDLKNYEIRNARGYSRRKIPMQK